MEWFWWVLKNDLERETGLRVWLNGYMHGHGKYGISLLG